MPLLYLATKFTAFTQIHCAPHLTRIHPSNRARHLATKEAIKKPDGSTEPEKLQGLLTALSKHRPICCAVLHSKNAPQGTQMPLL